MTADDPIEAVIDAYLDHLENGAPRPSLEHLDAADRALAQALLDGLATARGIDPVATRPSIEALLTDTPLAGLLPALADAHPARTDDLTAGPVAARTGAPAPGTHALAAGGHAADLATVELVLAGVDPRARLDRDEDGDAVVYSYLDLRARFVRVAGTSPRLDAAARRTAAAVFAADPDTSRVGLVAADSPDLVTLVVTPDEVGPAVATAGPAAHRRREAALPLPLAARRMLEQSAPEWPAYDVGPAAGEAFDVAALAVDIARRVVGREAGRAYRGDKRTAYRSLVGQEDAIARLVALVCTPGARVDLAAEADRIARVAA